jgi:hypothetical protein
MAEQYFNSDIYADGKIKLTTVPNATGTVVTYNATTKELSTRTNAQFISDLGLNSDLTAYVKKTGDTMSGSLHLINVAGVIKRDLSTITAASGFARDLYQLIGTNGIIDTMGWYGSVDATGNVTMGYGFMGGTSYSVKNAFRWTPDQRVLIGGTGLPSGTYALDIVGDTLTRGSYNAQGAFNSASGELLVQRFGINRIRTNTTSIILSGDSTNGIVYLRPQGDSVSTSEVQFRANLSAIFQDNYNLHFGNQTTTGSSLFHTNKTDLIAGYGMWMNHNLQFDGTNFIQPRGSIGSYGFTANYHKGFSFNYASATGTNGSVVALSEVVKINNTGTITTLNHGDSSQWISGFNNGFLYRGVLGNTDLNTIITTGWYVQTGNANATVVNNYPAPAGLAGQLRVYATATHLVQEYTTYANNNDVYRRYYFNGTWYAWAKDWDSNDFTQTNINSWNNIAANGATQQWVDQYYVNKSTQNVIANDQWFITSDYSSGMEDKITFRNGYLSLEWDQSRMVFSDEGFVDLIKYGIRQDDPLYSNLFFGNTQFRNVFFENAQGISPFSVTSSTLVTNLNADLLDGRHASDFVLTSQIGNYVPTSRTITINGVTQDLTANRTWNTPDTVTRLRGTASGTYVSGDVTLAAGANITISQSGQTITIASSGGTYTAGNGLTLTGTQFSLPVVASGTGNGVANVTQTATGIQVTMGNYMTTSHAANAITTTNINNWNTAFGWGNHATAGYALADGTNATDTWSSASRGLVYNPFIAGKTFNASGATYLQDATYGSVSGVLNSSGIAQGNPSDTWYHRIKMLHDNSAGYYTEIAVQMTGGNGMHYKRYEGGVDQGWIKVWDNSNFNPDNYVTLTGNPQTITSPKTFNTNVTINGNLQANGLLGNGSQSNSEVWTTDGGYINIGEISRLDAQWRFQIDGLTKILDIKPTHDLGVVIYEGGGIENTTLLLPRITRQGQEVQIINKADAVVLIGKVSGSTLMPLNPGDTFRYVFEIYSNVGDFSEDIVDLGAWIHIATEKYTEL